MVETPSVSLIKDSHQIAPISKKPDPCFVPHLSVNSLSASKSSYAPPTNSKSICDLQNELTRVKEHIVTLSEQLSDCEKSSINFTRISNELNENVSLVIY